MNNQTESDLLTPILADSDNDSLRLHYAEWLISQQNPRGQFIQIQCQLAQLPDQPSQRKMELENLQQQLLDQYRQEWAAPLTRIEAKYTYSYQYAIRDYQFHRGFIDTITITNEDLVYQGDQIFALAPIKHLQITNSNQFSLKPSRYLDQIYSLNLRMNEIDDRMLAQWLRLSEYKQLRTLEIGSNNITASGLAALLSAASMPQLESLIIDSNPLGDEAIKLLSESPRLRAIKRLDLARTKISAAAISALAASPFAENIIELKLNNNEIGNEGLRALAQSTTLRSLRSLAIVDTKIDAQGFAALMSEQVIFRLLELTAGKNHLSAQCAELLANCAHFNQLQLLYLPVCNIGASGAQAIAASPYLKQLRRLDLNDNNIGNQGVAALAKSTLLTPLYQLRLAKNNINDQGALSLVKSTALAAINPYSTIDLIGNPLGITSIRAMLLSDIRPLQITAKYQTPQITIGPNFLKPKRRNYQQAIQIAAGSQDAQQLWQKFTELNLTPQNLSKLFPRVFEQLNKVSCPDCGGSGTSGYYDPCYSCYGGWIDSFEIVTTPPTTELVILLAADLEGINRAEKLAIEMIDQLRYWAFQPDTDQFLLRWRLNNNPEIFYWHSLRFPPFEVVIKALKELNHDPLIKNLQPVVGGWVEIASLSWELAAKAGIEPYHSNYKNPFQILIELQKTGYTIGEITNNSILLIMPLLKNY